MIKYSKTNLIVMADSEKKKKSKIRLIKYSDRNLIIMKYSETNNRLTFW